MHKPVKHVLRSSLLGLALLIMQGAVIAAEKTPERRLVIGLVPNISARTLISAFQPMRGHLEKQLKRPVEIYTAPNFRAFYESTQRGDFDLVVTPAHFAWLAMREAHYVPLMTYQTPLRGLIIVKRESPITSARALHGKKIGITDPLAIVTMRGLQWLKEQGLQRGDDFSVHKASPHNTAALAVGSGELDAAIIGSGPYRLMPEEIRSQVQVLSEVGAVPNATYLANGEMPAKQRNALQGVLLAFGNTPEGRQFMEQYGYGGFKLISAADLKPMGAYSQQAKALLAGASN